MVGVTELNSGDVGRLKPFGALDYIELHRITLDKGLKTVACDGGEMYEDILALFLLKKTETLAVIEPFYSTCYHTFYSFCPAVNT